MRVLVACERSQKITAAFRKRGHEAYSCDIEPCTGGHPEWHIKDKVQHVLTRMISNPEWTSYGIICHPTWDLMIAHPPCTHLAVSGARWFQEKRADGRQAHAIAFFTYLMNAPVLRICIENPVGIMSGKKEYLKKYYSDFYERAKDFPEPQYIQPYEYGHGETKKTCLWLKNLPKLVPTNIVEGRADRIHKMPPSKERGYLRSITYDGWADAMAEQWG